MFDLSSLPHKKLILTLGAFAALAVVIIESTNIRVWFYETGAIHLVAILFCLIAMFILSGTKRISDEGIKDFSKFAAAAAVALGLAHVFEYLGDTRRLYSDDFIFAILSSTYFIAASLVLYGASRLLSRAGVKTGFIKAVLFGLAVLQGVAVGLLFYQGGRSSSTVGDVFLLMLVLVGMLYFWVLDFLARKMQLLVVFARHLQIASAFILLSYSMDFFKEQISQIGISEGRIETVLHYFFYLGLSLFLLSFDLLRHFGGIYSDLQKEDGAGGVQA